MPYLNFHRPCFFPATENDKKGKAVKHYHYKDMMAPHEKLKSPADAASFRKPGVTFTKLDQQSIAMTDNQADVRFTAQRNKLFSQIFKQTRITGLTDDVQAHCPLGKHAAKYAHGLGVKCP